MGADTGGSTGCGSWLCWWLCCLDHGLRSHTAHSTGIPFLMERAVREPGSASAVTVQSSQWHLALPQLILAQSHSAMTCHLRDTPEPRNVWIWEVSLGPQQRPSGLGEATCASPLSQPRALSQPSSSKKLKKVVFGCGRQLSCGDRCECLAWLSQDICFSSSLCRAGARSWWEGDEGLYPI